MFASPASPHVSAQAHKTSFMLSQSSSVPQTVGVRATLDASSVLVTAWVFVTRAPAVDNLSRNAIASIILDVALPGAGAKDWHKGWGRSANLSCSFHTHDFVILLSRFSASTGQRRASQFKELAPKGTLSAKSGTLGTFPTLGDQTTPLDIYPATMSPERPAKEIWCRRPILTRRVPHLRPPAPT